MILKTPVGNSNLILLDGLSKVLLMHHGPSKVLLIHHGPSKVLLIHHAHKIWTGYKFSSMMVLAFHISHRLHCGGLSTRHISLNSDARLEHLQSRFPCRDCTDLCCARGAQGVVLMRVRVNCQSIVSTVSDDIVINGCGRLQLGVLKHLSAVISMAQAVPNVCVSRKVFPKHQVNWNTVCGAIRELPWRNIWLSDNPVEVLNEHLSLRLDVMYQPRSSVCVTRINLGLTIN